MGPVGSGKSVMCCWDIFRKSCLQKADPYTNTRKSRWLVLRSTYRELEKTSLKTWLDWFPQTDMRMSAPISGVLRLPHPLNDGTIVQIELEFLAIDDEKALRNLKSLEVTGVWANEAGEIPWSYLSRAFERTGRYPRADSDAGVKYVNHGMIMDTNPPSDTSWWYKLAEIQKPDGMTFFRQPPAVLKRQHRGKTWYEPNDGREAGIPTAENIENHNEGWDYYMRQTTDGDHARIKVFLMGEYGSTVSGTPVYPEYNDMLHYRPDGLEVHWGLPLIMGTDFGRTPSAVIGQLGVNGQIRLLEEVRSEDMGITQFTQELLKPLLVNKYRFYEMRMVNFGDPAGAMKGQTDERTCVDIMNENGIHTLPCPVPANNFTLRREAVASCLRRMSDGEPGLIVNNLCPIVREGFNGRYYYKKAAVADLGDERVISSPVKNLFSHPHDAVQYLVYGALHSGEVNMGSEGCDRYGIFERREAELNTSIDMAGFY